ncbi:MAG: response regulator transcription factor [Lachnospiraceae bacterium]|nr:response regulator transcription factor [Lachnospiraceae bacterium]
MNRILIVEDDLQVCEILQFYLMQTKQYDVTVVHSAESALCIVQNGRYDAILLDVMLPGEDGIAFCEKIRKKIYCPIIFISCLNDDETIVRALNMGGDDYIVKPFRGPVLLAHLEANLRRSAKTEIHEGDEVLTVGELTLDPATHRVMKRGEELVLSPTEYELLFYMMRERGHFLDFDQVYTEVWQRPSLGDLKTLFVHVRNLRKKIEDDPTQPRYITTYRRKGYIFAEDLDIP